MKAVYFKMNNLYKWISQLAENFTLLWKEILNNDGQQFHQYQ